MVSNPLFQHHKAQVVLTLALLAVVPASVSAAQPASSTQPTSTQLVPTQLAQAGIIYPTLRVGSTGETVSRLQATLKLLGFYQGSVDGDYSQLTQQAVISFQTATNLTADGITGPATWRKLLPTPNDVDTASASSASSDNSSTETPAEPVASETAQSETTVEATSQEPPVLRPSAEGTAVSQLQRELQALGYYDSAIDGKYGELTEAAVRQFQSDQQLLVDAVVGPSTWEALSRALGE
ncbi:MAG: peptidoglycan-binding domain-containing protein [Cyanobacteria bacterium P01_D01_bin.1]